MGKLFVEQLEINMKSIVNRECTFSNFAVCPWSAVNYDESIKFYPKVKGDDVTSDSSDVVRLAANLETINVIKDTFGPFYMELWPDGSVKDDIGAGSGLVFTQRHNSSRATEKPSKVYNAAASIGPSFHAEATAINISLIGIIKDYVDDVGWNNNNKLLICTDSQSLVSSLKSGPIKAKYHLCISIWESLLKLRNKFSLILFQHVFSHCDLDRNEMADVQVDQFLDSCSAKDHSKVSIPLRNIKAILKLRMKHNQLSSLNVEQHRYKDAGCGSKYTDLKASSLFSRSDETLVTQLRTGKCRVIGDVRKHVLKIDGTCRWCKRCEESVSHLFNDCLQKDVRELRNSLHINCTSLSKNPSQALEFFKKALLLIGIGNPD
jgi:ribonuclease HI